MRNLRQTLPLGLHYEANARPLSGLTTRSINANASRVRTPSERKSISEDVSFIGSIKNLGDGDVVLFGVESYSMFFLVDGESRRVSRPPRKGSYPVIFVNGMQGNPEKFRAQACAIAAATGGPVHGVYNATGSSILPDAINKSKFVPNALLDLLECTTDKLQSTDLDQFKAWIKKKTGTPQHIIERDMISNLSKYNRAAGKLLYLLLQPGYEAARIVAHSQGNIITCNAVNAVAALRGGTAIASMKIDAVASPVTFWSEAGMLGQNIVTTHAFANDLVAWLGMNFSTQFFLAFRAPKGREGKGWEGTEISDSYNRTFRPDMFLTHNFYAYLEAIWLLLRYKYE